MPAGSLKQIIRPSVFNIRFHLILMATRSTTVRFDCARKIVTLPAQIFTRSLYFHVIVGIAVVVAGGVKFSMSSILECACVVLFYFLHTLLSTSQTTVIDIGFVLFDKLKNVTEIFDTQFSDAFTAIVRITDCTSIILTLRRHGIGSMSKFRPVIAFGPATST